MHYALTAEGQILSRVQNWAGTSDPRTYHQFVGGHQVGEYTNDSAGDPSYLSYDKSIANHGSIAGSGNFAYGSTTGTAGGRFGTSGYDATNPVRWV